MPYRILEYEVAIINDKTFLSKMMLIERGKNIDEIIKILNEVVLKTKDEDKELLKRIILIIFEEKIGYKETMKLIDKLEGGNKEMLAVVETIRRENQMYINMGRKEMKNNLYQIAKKLIERNTPKEDILEITGLKEKDIEKIVKMN